MAIAMQIETTDEAEGFYSVSEAADLLRRDGRAITGAKVRRWLEAGLTYTRRDLGRDASGLTFHDLVSLELVARFRDQGVSLQRVHRLEERLREQLPGIERPFATELFFTDGVSVWAALGSRDDMVEVLGRRAGHVVWTDAIRTFAEEIDFGADHRAARWRRAPGIELDPERQSGRPVVAGTRIPVDTIERALRDGSPDEVAAWYGMSVEQVANVEAFLVR